MARIPFLGRLFWREYLALAGSILLVLLEVIARIVAVALPSPILRLLYNSSRRLFIYLSSPQGRKSRNKKKEVVTAIAQATDFVELCHLFGYYAEEHVVTTKDGYLLGLHRLGWRKGEQNVRVNAGRDSVKKRVVYLHHGLLMNSDVWVCLTEEERCLPFMLAEQGYDVWLGNNRGNKYSKKSIHHTPNETKFWDFSIDEFAFHDIPDSINYILESTSQPSLSYIGFSQGTAQAFATLSIHPALNEKVNVFIALAPAMSPPGLSGGIVNSLIKTSPEVIFLAFGRRSILSSTVMWQAILYPPIFVRVIDMALSFLFGWTSKNMAPHQKLAAYPHLYSLTSTKSVVHWFQIIRNRTFQMYDDEVMSGLARSNKHYKPAKFPTRNIRTPIVLVYGGSDSLVNIDTMLSELPTHTKAIAVPHFEHLDFLWATDVEKLVFPHVFNALDKHSHAGDVSGSKYYSNPDPDKQDQSPSPASDDSGSSSDNRKVTQQDSSPSTDDRGQGQGHNRPPFQHRNSHNRNITPSYIPTRSSSICSSRSSHSSNSSCSSRSSSPAQTALNAIRRSNSGRIVSASSIPRPSSPTTKINVLPVDRRPLENWWNPPSTEYKDDPPVAESEKPETQTASRTRTRARVPSATNEIVVKPQRRCRHHHHGGSKEALPCSRIAQHQQRNSSTSSLTSEGNGQNGSGSISAGSDGPTAARRWK